MDVTRNLNQDITYWPPAGEDKYGEREFEAPQLIKGRWEERTEEVMSYSGDTIVSQAIVYVDEDLAHDGFLAEGDFSSATSPHSVETAYQIRVVRKIPDLRSNNFERSAVL